MSVALQVEHGFNQTGAGFQQEEAEGDREEMNGALHSLFLDTSFLIRLPGLHIANFHS